MLILLAILACGSKEEDTAVEDTSVEVADTASQPEEEDTAEAIEGEDTAEQEDTASEGE